MSSNSSVLTGNEAISLLEKESSDDLKRVRQLVEEAIRSDINAYLGSLGQKTVPPTVINSLVTAAIAGGQLGFNNLVIRLDAAQFKIKDLDQAANQLLSLTAGHVTVLNYARFRTGSVQSIINKIMNTSMSTEDQAEVKQLLGIRIQSEKSLYEWAKNIELFFEQEAAFQGQVSTRSISSYSKHWNSYVSEKILPIMNLTWNGKKEDTIEHRIKYLTKYSTLNEVQIKKILSENTKQAIFKSSVKRSKIDSSHLKLITSQHDLGGRKLKITHDAGGVDKDLILPAINSMKGQMIMNPKQAKLMVNMSSDSSTLIIELEMPKKNDVENLKVLLDSFV
jgi:hypothetical protein